MIVPTVGAVVEFGPLGTRPAARTTAHASSALSPTTSGTSVIRGSLRTPQVYVRSFVPRRGEPTDATVLRCGGLT